VGLFPRLLDNIRIDNFIAPNVGKLTIHLTTSAIEKYLPHFKPSFDPPRAYDYLNNSIIEKIGNDNAELFGTKAIVMTSKDSNNAIIDEYLNKIALKSAIRALDFGNEQDDSGYQQLIEDYKPQQGLLLDLFKLDTPPSFINNFYSHTFREPIFEPIGDFGRLFHGIEGIDTFITSKPDTYYLISNLPEKNQITLIYPDQSDHSNPFSYPIVRPNNPTLDFGDKKVNYNLFDIERVQFSNKNIAFDLQGNAGLVAKIYGAVLGARSLSDTELIGSGLKSVDDGLDATNFATLVLKSTGLESHTDIVNDLWFNVAGFKPTAEEIQPFINQLDSGEKSIGDLVLYAANHPLNEINIDLVGLTNHGIQFT